MEEQLKKVYSLTCEDLSRLGGAMGTDRTSVLFRKLFLTLDGAKRFAEVDNHRRNGEPIIWGKSDGTIWYSGDLSSHDYTIALEKVLS